MSKKSALKNATAMTPAARSRQPQNPPPKNDPSPQPQNLDPQPGPSPLQNQTTNDPLPEELAAESNSSTNSEKPAITAAHIADEIDPNAGDDGPALDGGGAGAGGVILSRDDFRRNILGVFGLAGTFTGLQSLKIATEEAAAAAAASDALYDSALEVTWLRFLVQPESVWMQRALAMGGFAVPKYLGVMAELRARKGVGIETRAGARGPLADAVSPMSMAGGAREPELPNGAVIAS